MKKLLLLTLIACLPSLAFAQGGCKTDSVQTQNNVGAFIPVVSAKVRVCANGDTAQPCTPVSIYSDLALTVPISNPITTDSLGRYSYCATLGSYNEQISGSGIVGIDNQPITLGVDLTSPGPIGSVVPSTVRATSVRVQPVTVSALGSASTAGAGTIRTVSDGNSASDCTIGGGSTQVTCISNGTAWGSSSFNAASPGPIGGTTPDAGTFTDIKTKTTPVADVRAYGAKVDGKALGDGYGAWSTVQSGCSMTAASAALTCPTGTFTASDVGKVIAVYEAGPTTGGFLQPLSTTISTYTDSAHVTLAVAATATVANSTRVVWGTDDTTADQAAIAAACSAGSGDVYVPKGRSLVSVLTITCSNVGISGQSRKLSALENWNIAVTDAVVHIYSSPSVDQSTKGNFIRRIELRQVANPTSTAAKVINLYTTYKALVEDTRMIGYSYECAVDGGGSHNYGDELRNSELGPCGHGGPGYSSGVAAINYNGANVSIHDNYVWGSAQGEEYGGREGHIFHNEYDGSALDGTNQGLCFNLGSTGAGIWNVWFTGNHCTKFSQAVSGSNGIGTFDRVHIDNNYFEDSGNVSVAGGLDQNSVVCYAPLTNTCENDTIVHGGSTVIGNTITSDTVAGGIVLNNTTGSNLSLALESWTVKNNVHQVNYAGFVTANGSHITVKNAIPVWQPSTAYLSTGNNIYLFPQVLNGWAYKITTSGTSGTSEPTWCTTLNCTVSDGTAVYTATYRQPLITVDGDRFNFPAGVTSNGYDFIFDGASREMVAISNVSGNYAWQFYGRTGDGRSNTLSCGIPGCGAQATSELVPAGVIESDLTRYYDKLPSATAYGATYRRATYFPLGTRILPVTPTSSSMGQVVTTAGWNAPAWVAANSYGADSYIQAPTDNGHFYRNLAACTSAGSAPTFPTTSGATVADNTCTWIESGPDAQLASLTPATGLGDPGSNGIVKRTATNTTSVATAADVDSLYSGTGKCYLYKGTTPGTNDGCDVPSGTGGASIVASVAPAIYVGIPTVSYTTLYTPSTAGLFRFCAFVDTTVAGTAGNLYIALKGTSDGNLINAADVTGYASYTQGSMAQGCYTFYEDAGTAIQWSLAPVSITGTPSYRYGITLEHLE